MTKYMCEEELTTTDKQNPSNKDFRYGDYQTNIIKNLGDGGRFKGEGT